jgi:hypothetical protein
VPAATETTDETAAARPFRRLLDELGIQADQMIAEFMAQDPATIDLAGRVESLPGKVLDVLVALHDQLNVESRAALTQWKTEKEERHRKMWEWDEQQYPYNRAILDWQAQSSHGSAALGRHDWQHQSPYYREMVEWQEQQSRRNRELWEQLEGSERAFRASLPPNWNSPEIDFPSLADLEVLQLEEGLPLAWVPPNSVLQAILSCATSASRRRVIARESSAILAACLRELRRLRSVETTGWRASAREATSAMKDGHWSAGQALAAIALDTATAKFVRSSYKDATSHSRRGKGSVRVATPPGSSEASLPTWRDVDYPRALLVLHGIFGAFAEYDGAGGDAVPKQFTRHGTIHSVGRPQYSKANALIALMHLVGLMCLIEDE